VDKKFSKAQECLKEMEKDMERDMDALEDLADAKMIQVEKKYLEKAGNSLFSALEDLEISLGKQDAVGAVLAHVKSVNAYKKAIVGLV